MGKLVLVPAAVVAANPSRNQVEAAGAIAILTQHLTCSVGLFEKSLMIVSRLRKRLTTILYNHERKLLQFIR